jgi:dehydrogenase/reductase SDR family member 12
MRPGVSCGRMRRFDPDDLAVDLSGKRAVVTGGSSGLGLATADALLQRGAQVALVCRDQQRGEEAIARLLGKHRGARLELRRLDVGQRREVRAFCDDEPGPIDMLVHAASELPSRRELTDDGLERSFATHVAGPHLLTALLAERLRPGARVVFVGSVGLYLARLSLEDLDWSRRAYDGLSAYAQTRRMQVILTRLWAERLAPRAHVYAMHPGWTDTPSLRRAFPRFWRLTHRVLRTPAEAADTVLWLLSRAVPPAPSGALFFDRREVAAHLLPWTEERQADVQALVMRLDRPIEA